MSEANKQLVRRWFEEVWNKGRVEAVDEMLGANAIVHGLSDDSGNPLIGPASFKPFHEKFREAFPDIIVKLDDLIAEGDKVAVRCSVQGKHQGRSLGFDATQAPVGFTGMVIVRIDEGKIIEAWNNFDFMKMYQQIGALKLLS